MGLAAVVRSTARFVRRLGESARAVRPPSARTLLVLLIGGAALAAVAATSGVVGYWAAKRNIPEKVQARYVGPFFGRMARALGVDDDSQTVEWRPLATNRQQVELARVSATNETGAFAWALAPVGQNLVMSSRHGRLSYLDSSNRLASLNLATPQRFDALLESSVGQDPVFELGDYRTFDLLAVETGPQRYDLYASFARYADAGCIEVAVARTPLESGPEGVKAVTGDWEDVYVMRPCLPIKYTGMRFAGHEGGGRLALKDRDTLLFSVGVFQYDNVAAGQLAGQDPSTDLGKIVAVTLSTGEARIYASGFRNPQGLLVARDGAVWETEHGPRGGDEVNLIEEGGNYGWPYATYGMDYAEPPRDWPFSPTPGRHDGYAEPAFVFTPSIGVSNVIQPDPRAFPGWSHTLVAGSLSATTLYILHLVDHRIVSAEPYLLGERLRDIVSLDDGRIAIATDAGQIILIRAAVSEGEPQEVEGAFVVSGSSTLGSASPPNLPAQNLGALYFQYSCASCHSLTGSPGVGPHLDGVVGRRVASVEGQGYSRALQSAGGTWSRGRLVAFINDPQAVAPGSVMPKVDVLPGAAEAIARYLAGVDAVDVHAGDRGGAPASPAAH